MSRSSFAKKVINNYRHIVDLLQNNNLLDCYYELSAKDLSGNKTQLTYCNKSNISNILYDTSLNATVLYEKLVSNKQFNLKFIDASIVMFECIINGEKIDKLRILYLKPYEGYIEHHSHNESWEEYQLSDYNANELSFPILLRIDYNRNENKKDHPLCHITLSNLKNCRIPSKGLVGFDRFIEFILHQNFNRYDIVIPKIIDEECIRNVEKSMLHLNWEYTSTKDNKLRQ